MGSKSSHQTTSMPLVSIIIPAYNAAKSIEKLLRDVSRQTYNHLEIIVIDDGSIDETAQVVKRVMADDSRIKLIRQKNQGVSSARNNGIKKARGDFMMFFDDDDSVSRKIVDTMLHAIQSHPKSLVVCGKQISDGRKILPSQAGLISHDLKKHVLASILKDGLLYSPCNKIYESAIVKNNTVLFPDDVKYGEDLIFNLTYLAHVSSIFYIQEPLYFYQLTHQGLSGRNASDASSRAAMFRQLEIYVGKPDFSSKALLALISLRWRLSVMKAKMRQHG